VIEISDEVFTAALESAYKSGLEAGIESERSRIARIISDTAYDASSGLTPGLLSKAVMVVAKRVFGDVNV